MGRVTIGESSAEKAMKRMEKHIDRSNRRGDKANTAPTLLEQIQAAYPDTWREELREMKRETSDEEYMARKIAARASFEKEYLCLSRPERDAMSMTEKQFIGRKMKSWMEENR
jgi:hypothetical protein